MDKEILQIAVQIGLSLLLGVFSIKIVPLIHASLVRFGGKKKMLEKRITYIRKIFSMLVYFNAALLFTLIWGIDFRGILIFASSFFAVIGVALFASWSILSNLTASVILFFSFPYKIGDKIKILDGDNSVSGELSDITLFNLQIRDEKGNTVVFPNNLAMQKAIVKYAKE
ncbi:MAG: mechanosensitive ion channel domain-containing protein [Desulfobacter sp.]